jgi:hypothetical protein
LAYLDDTAKVNLWILVGTIPGLALISLELLSTVAVDSTSALEDVRSVLETVSSVAWISPLFLLIQFAMITRGTANASWQNLLCILLTLVGAIMAWSSRLA